MKTKLLKVLIYILKGILRFIYFFLKAFPTKKEKVVFCSRQSNDIPLDFELIEEALIKKNPSIKCVNICRHIGSGVLEYVKFAGALLKSMYHIGTSSVCVIDSYWPAVSLLRHKESLTVIQIWHAIGKIKKSGYQTIGKKSGRKKEYARLLNMHGNYDYVVAGAEAWNKYYCESFGITEEKILNYGLPRIDYLINTEDKNKREFFKKYPELKSCKIILYAPTFRKNMRSRWTDIIKAFENENYILIIKNHPGQILNRINGMNQVYYLDEWKTIDLIAVSDYIITDYSAISLEAAVLKKQVYFWVYDYDEYMENNGLNIDIMQEAQGYAFKDIKTLLESIKTNVYEKENMYKFCDKYLPKEIGKATDKITNTIINFMEI